MRALSIRQPHAEAVMRGIKTIESRSRLTNIRERFYVYAGLKIEDDYDWWLKEEYGIDNVTYDELPRGVIVGTAELYGCDLTEDGEYYQWHLRDPRRITPKKPDNHPQPAWFNPFD